MSRSEEQPASVPGVPENQTGDPAKRRRQTFWMVLACIILIIVAVALIVNELAGQGRP